jgi:hypothetical protein
MEVSVSDNPATEFLKPTIYKIVLGFFFVLYFGLSAIPGFPLSTNVPYLTNNLFAPFVDNLYADVTLVGLLVSTVFAYLFASTVYFLDKRYRLELPRHAWEIISVQGVESGVKHVGVALVTALLFGLVGVPLPYYDLGTQCPGVLGNSCTPVGASFSTVNLGIDLVFWYLLWGIGFHLSPLLRSRLS